ncbi:hypothetical protein GGC65_002428 [Sphingopyxis sp. OAS728]|uniref:hypothetical protein n=1 Tax=Sphingopyxis sp. OAS728 TaxID=2663823 RepID=UPI00178B3F56|nr:hypothetical protein [Sphingopyxis sp. OAS728]MBE1527972.1 hypothetical protein [Sphingopyxis sp. OAS728]
MSIHIGTEQRDAEGRDMTDPRAHEALCNVHRSKPAHLTRFACKSAFVAVALLILSLLFALSVTLFLQSITPFDVSRDSSHCAWILTAACPCPSEPIVCRIATAAIAS